MASVLVVVLGIHLGIQLSTAAFRKHGEHLPTATFFQPKEALYKEAPQLFFETKEFRIYLPQSLKLSFIYLWHCFTFFFITVLGATVLFDHVFSPRGFNRNFYGIFFLEDLLQGWRKAAYCFTVTIHLRKKSILLVAAQLRITGSGDTWRTAQDLRTIVV